MYYLFHVRDLGIANSPTAINNNWVVVGWTYIGDLEHAVRWPQSGPSPLDWSDIGPGYAEGINDLGIIVGSQIYATGGEGQHLVRAMLWTSSGSEPIYDDGRHISGSANAVNEKGSVV